MKKNVVIIFFAVFAVFLFYPFYKSHLPQKFHDIKKGLLDRIELASTTNKAKKFKQADIDIELPKIIAHAGGGIYELPYTNSREALELNYSNNFRWFEMDAIFTSDNHLVMLHDWGSAIPGLFGETEGVRTIDKFFKMNMVSGLSQLDFGQTVEWFLAHPDTYLLLDNKSDLKKTLEVINLNYKEIKPQIILTINRFHEYLIAREMGFEKIFFSLHVLDYGLTYPDDLIIDFVSKNQILAVCVPQHRAKSNLPMILNEHNIFTYAFTVDDEDTAHELIENYNINGIISNFITNI